MVCELCDSGVSGAPVNLSLLTSSDGGSSAFRFFEWSESLCVTAKWYCSAMLSAMQVCCGVSFISGGVCRNKEAKLCARPEKIGIVKIRGYKRKALVVLLDR